MPVKKSLVLLMFFVIIAVLTGCSSGSGGHGTEPAAEADTQGESAGHKESASPAGTGSHGETKAPEATKTESSSHGEAATTEPQESNQGNGEAGKSAAPQHTAEVPPVPTPTPTPAPTPTPKGAVKDGWVLSIPDLVPRFGYGELDLQGSKITEASISTLYHLRFAGVQKTDMDAYCLTLQKAGFTAAAAEIGNTYTLTAAKDLGWNSVALVITLTESDSVAVFALDAPV